MGLFDKPPAIEGVNSYGKPKLPPGQTATAKYPVLTYGDAPAIEPRQWRFGIWGRVVAKEWTWDEFMRLPQSTVRADFHCVTHWSRFDDQWGGVMSRDLVGHLEVMGDAKFVLQHAYGGYTTNLPLQSMIDEEVMFAHTWNGNPLAREHGGPMRVITPRRYAWKGAKWIRGLEFLAKDSPGFWETNGYSNTADPWKEERFW